MMSSLRTGLRGWGWLGWVVVVEVVLLGAQAVPTLLPAPAAVTAARQASAATAPERASLQPILDFQPFGVSAPPADRAEPANTEATPAPEDSLVLQGVLLRDDATASRAMISVNGGPAKIYTTGDLLPGGGTLSAIEVDRISIDLEGQKRILRFPEPGTSQPAPDQTASEPDTDTNASATPPAPINPSAAPPKAQTLKQPDLRHLIPGLIADTLSKP